MAADFMLLEKAKLFEREAHGNALHRVRWSYFRGDLTAETLHAFLQGWVI